MIIITRNEYVGLKWNTNILILLMFSVRFRVCASHYTPYVGVREGGRGGETEREETFILSSRIKYLHISLNRFVLISYECDLIQFGRKWDKRHEAYISPLTSLLGNTLTRSHSLQLIQLHLSSCSLPPLVYSHSTLNLPLPRDFSLSYTCCCLAKQSSFSFTIF